MPFSGTSWIGSQDYNAAQDRMYAMGLFFCEGVLPAIGENPQQTLFVSPGSALSVNIAPGWALIQGGDQKNQGMYTDYNEGSILNFRNPFGAPASSPRVDLVCVQVQDSEVNASASPADQAYTVWVKGTEQPGADPTDSSFFPAAPLTALVLASVVVSPSQTTYTVAQIIDQRKLAGPMIWGEDGNRYRLGVDANGNLGTELLT